MKAAARLAADRDHFPSLRKRRAIGWQMTGSLCCAAVDNGRVSTSVDVDEVELHTGKQFFGIAIDGWHSNRRASVPALANGGCK
jgi:hypothetical protein